MQTNKIIGFIFLAVFMIFSVVGFFILPDTLVMQINLQGGAGTTMSKTLGLLVTLALGGFVSIKLAIEKNSHYNVRWYIALVVILFINIMIFIFNL